MLRACCIRAGRRARILALALAACGPTAHAQTGSLSVSAVVLSKNNCKFSSNAALALNFATIDPSSGSNATATATAGFSCAGSAPMASFSITAGDGLYPSGVGARQMRHASVLSEFLAYSLVLSPAMATVPKNAAQTLTVTGTVTPSAFGNAIAGTYSDTVALTLNP